MHTIYSLFLVVLLAGCASVPPAVHERQTSIVLLDVHRQRPIPVEIYAPAPSCICTATRPCPVALLSAGYGVSNKNYNFIASALTDRCHLLVSIQHELPSDPPLATLGDLFAARQPNWQRGAASLRFVHEVFRASHPGFQWEQPMLIGHSNGGDISAWLLRESPDFSRILVTLDNRRVPLPRAGKTRVLSIRASDFRADPGVIPTGEELESTDSCVLTIAGARHNDMQDAGPADLKTAIAEHLAEFLDGACNTRS